jgi:hypothetical protein
MGLHDRDSFTFLLTLHTMKLIFVGLKVIRFIFILMEPICIARSV